MKELNELYEATINVVQNIEDANADELIELVELREKLINLINLEKSLSTNHKETLIEIIRYDQLICSRMSSLKNEATGVLRNISNSRFQKNKYEAQYTSESYFVDMRE